MKPLLLSHRFSLTESEFRETKCVTIVCLFMKYCLFAYVLKVIFTHLVLLGYHCLVFNMFTLETVSAWKKNLGNKISVKTYYVMQSRALFKNIWASSICNCSNWDVFRGVWPMHNTFTKVQYRLPITSWNFRKNHLNCLVAKNIYYIGFIFFFLIVCLMKFRNNYVNL